MIIALSGGGYKNLLKSEKAWIFSREQLPDAFIEKIIAILRNNASIKMAGNPKIIEFSLSAENEIVIKTERQKQVHNSYYHTAQAMKEYKHFLVIGSEVKSNLAIMKDWLDSKAKQLTDQAKKLTELSDVVSRIVPSTKKDPPKEIKLPPKNNPLAMGDRPC